MPPYVAGEALLAEPGAKLYSFGSNNDYTNVAVEGAINAYSVTSNVVTVYVTRGFTPNFSVGKIVKCNTTGIAALDGASLTVATVTNESPATDGFHFTASLTTANVAKTTITGRAVQQAPTNPETAEAMATGAGQQFALTSFLGQSNNCPAISYEIETPSAPASFTVHLQGALRDVDAEYFNIDGSSGATAVGINTIALGQQRVKFFRLNVTAVTGGTNPTIVGKLLV